MTDLVVSIGTLDNFEALARCLDSVFQENAIHLTYRVHVVYNGREGEGTLSRIRERYPQVELTVMDGPQGYCLPHNLVLRASGSRYVLILDDDTIVHPGTLSKMVEFMDRHPRVGMSGCRTLNPDGSYQKSYALFSSLATEALGIVKSSSSWPERLYDDADAPREVDWLNGSFMLVRSQTVEEVGLLDEDYFTYSCEQDWCYRMRKAGWSVVYVPTASIVHVGGEHSINTDVKPYSSLVRYHVNRYLFFHKHYGALPNFLLRPIMILAAGTRLLYFTLVLLMHRGARERARTRLRAFWTVIRLSLLPKPYRMPNVLR